MPKTYFTGPWSFWAFLGWYDSRLPPTSSNINVSFLQLNIISFSNHLFVIKGEKAHAMEKTMPSQYIHFNTSHPHFQLNKYSSSMNHTTLSRGETPDRSFQKKSSISRGRATALRCQRGGASLTSSSWRGQPPPALQAIRHGSVLWGSLIVDSCLSLHR